MTNSADERRKNKRVNVRIPAGVYFKNNPSECIDAEILDISLGGAFVHCTVPINIGDEIIVEIRFTQSQLLDAKVVVTAEKTDPSAASIFPEKAIVKWARGSSHSGFGIAFVHLHPEKQEFLKKLIQYFENLKRSGLTLTNR